ncbi:MAG: DUF4145 domain-containing protein, partial [Bacteroidota bacterium]
MRWRYEKYLISRCLEYIQGCNQRIDKNLIKLIDANHSEYIMISIAKSVEVIVTQICYENDIYYEKLSSAISILYREGLIPPIEQSLLHVIKNVRNETSHDNYNSNLVDIT